MRTASTILFVDDEELVVKYFYKAFGGVFKVETANSVSHAMSILDTQHSEIAVLLTDLNMPKQSGIDLLVYSKKHYPNIVRLLTSACSNTESYKNEINKADVFEVIHKPWNLDELETLLHKSLQEN